MNKIKKDTGSIWWGVLGFCIPLVGLVLCIAWRNTKPKSGKKAGIGALIGIMLGVIDTLIKIVKK